ncbi:O-antigen ligase family protein [Aerosakkonemataceae cyanobacterium BLCC-F50]|uniref:O-antigen ligase family protein n=1 Tax=Floridaenema flaviceps BLCC-F50 TaxID=3153642 RepID=A0ABV4XTE5_9CYAN
MKENFLKWKINTSHFHPDRKWQFLGNMFQLGLLTFPVIPAVGVVLLSLSALATWWKKYRQIISQPLTWGFAILSILLVIVSSFGYYRTEAYLGLGNLIPQFIFFTGISGLIQTPAQLRRISWILVITSVPVVIFGLVQILLGWGTDGAVQSFLGLAIAPTGNPPGRMSANFMYANILAAYLTIVFILNLGLLIENFPKKTNPQSPVPSPQSLFLIVALLGNALALLLTNSRNGWAIAVFACLTFAIYLGWRWLIFIVSGISGIVLLSAFAPSPIREPFRKIVPYFIWGRLSDEMFGDRPIPLLRSTQWNFALSLTQQRPLTGWGLRNFSPLYITKYSSYQMPIWLGHPHNLFLMLTAEIGIPATICFCSLVGWIIVQGFLLIRDWSDTSADKLIFFTHLVAFFGCILFNTADVTMFDLRVNALGWLLLAGIWGVVCAKRSKKGNLNGADFNPSQ